MWCGFLIAFDGIRLFFRYRCYFRRFQIQPILTVLDSSMFEPRQKPKSSKLKLSQQKCQMLPRIRVSIPQAMTVIRNSFHLIHVLCKRN